jgi:AcrR family transcriptional regulator
MSGTAPERTGPPTARGRHAPPPEVRLPLQRARLLRAAAADFAQHGYANTGSESISRRAGMSKATFYEHFANKEECILALFDQATEVLATTIAQAARAAGDSPRERMHAGTRAFMSVVAEHPDYVRTLLVEIIGAGPAAARRRDQVLEAFSQILDKENEIAAARGLSPRFSSSLDTVAVVGAITELVSRQVRLGDPPDPMDLAPVIERMIDGLLLAT